jgi:GR25 family glycosyltransferase involved in LPS biosynthesis
MTQDEWKSYFDGIYCINLDRRSDRWEMARKEFIKQNIPIERFPAIEMNDGRLGLVKTIGKLFQRAIDLKLRNLLLFEDDVQFTGADLKPSLNDLKLLQWELFYLGGNRTQPLLHVTRNLQMACNVLACHAVAFDQSVFKSIVDYAKKTNTIATDLDIWDVWLIYHVQNVSRSYFAFPVFAIQRPGYSDLEKRFVDYTAILK